MACAVCPPKNLHLTLYMKHFFFKQMATINFITMSLTSILISINQKKRLNAAIIMEIRKLNPKFSARLTQMTINRDYIQHMNSWNISFFRTKLNQSQFFGGTWDSTIYPMFPKIFKLFRETKNQRFTLILKPIKYTKHKRIKSIYVKM